MEGIPAVLLSVVVLGYLTDFPSRADWLDRDEKTWLNKKLQAEAYMRVQRFRPSVGQAILSPRTMLLGFIHFGAVAAQYALTFFVPQIVKGFGLGDTQTGFVAAIPFLIGGSGHGAMGPPLRPEAGSARRMLPFRWCWHRRGWRPPPCCLIPS